MSAHPWEHIVWEIEQESDPDKIAQLAKELNDAMVAEQKEKVKRRLWPEVTNRIAGLGKAPEVGSPEEKA